MKKISITRETRRSAYEEILETLGKRQIDIYKELLDEGNGMTANELAYKMFKKGYFLTPERNRVHPRLHELAKEGFVLIHDKKTCNISKRKCAVYVAIPEKEKYLKRA